MMRSDMFNEFLIIALSVGNFAAIAWMYLYLRDEAESRAAVVKSTLAPLQKQLSELKSRLDVNLITSDEARDLRFDLDNTKRLFEKEIKSEVVSMLGEVRSRGFTLMFNNMPYHQHFSSFDDRLKIAYFDACTSGDWTAVNRSLRQKT